MSTRLARGPILPFVGQADRLGHGVRLRGTGVQGVLASIPMKACWVGSEKKLSKCGHALPLVADHDEAIADAEMAEPAVFLANDASLLHSPAPTGQSLPELVPWTAGNYAKA